MQKNVSSGAEFHTKFSDQLKNGQVPEISVILK
jgi:hypothetical protein